MNAMIFAAGMGTRLQPLTNNIPKAMAPFQGKPLIWHAIKSLKGIGIKQIVVNVHHYASQIIDYISANNWDCEVLISDESGQLLETGGGLLKAKHMFIPNEPILIKNVDIITSINLESFISSHLENKNDVTLMVKSRSTSRYLMFNNHMQLCGWKNINTKEEIVVRSGYDTTDLAFSGIHMVEASLLDQMGDIRPFSIMQAYLDLAQNYNIRGYRMPDVSDWFDVGTIDKLREAELYYKSR